MACKKGMGIPLAYKGPCHRKATCSKIRCKETQNCLVDKKNGAPRCVTCVRRCKPRHMKGPICSTNNSTYQSWCHMMQDACSKGYVLETQHSGKCVSITCREKANKTDLFFNIPTKRGMMMIFIKYIPPTQILPKFYRNYLQFHCH